MTDDQNNNAINYDHFKQELDEVKLAYSNLLHDVLSFNELISKKDNTFDILTLVLRLSMSILDYHAGVISNYEGNEFNIIHSINLNENYKALIKDDIINGTYKNSLQKKHAELITVDSDHTRIVVPIITKQCPFGILDLYVNNPKNKIKQQDLDLLWILASIAAIEYESVEMSNRSELLSLMLASLEKINSEDQLDNLLYLILNNLKQIVPASSYLLILRDKLLEVSDSEHYCLPEIHSLDEICLLVDEAIKTRNTIFVKKLSQSKTCRDCTESYMHRDCDGSLMLVPLYKGDLGYGVISIFDKDEYSSVFSQYNRHIIEIFAKQATIAINNAILIDQQKKTNMKLAHTNDELQKAHDELSRRNKILNKEIESAGVVQSAILSNIDVSDKIDVCIKYRPHHSIGGDYYGIINLDDHRTLIFIGDVSGKGVPAAITNGFLKNEFTFVVNKQNFVGNITPAAVLSEVNNSAYDVFKVTEQFTSAWCGIIDSQNKTLIYASAGHDYPLLIVDSIKYLDDNNGPIMGLMEELQYKDKELDFSSPARLILYTDGITDQETKTGKRLGRQWLLDEAVKLKEAPPDKLSNTIFDKVITLSAGVEQHDDILLICVGLKH